MDGDAMNRHEYIRSDAPVLPGQPIIEGYPPAGGLPAGTDGRGLDRATGAGE